MGAVASQGCPGGGKACRPLGPESTGAVVGGRGQPRLPQASRLPADVAQRLKAMRKLWASSIEIHKEIGVKWKTSQNNVTYPQS